MRLLHLAFTAILCLAPNLSAQENVQPAPQPPVQPAYKSDPKFNAALAEATLLTAKRQYFFAIDAYKKASRIAGDKDLPCLNSLYDLQLRTGDYKGALNSTSAIQQLAVSPKEKAAAQFLRGRTLYLQAGDRNKADLLTAADAAFQTALAEDPKNASAHFLDGYVLARLNRMDAAREQFQQCLSCISPRDPSYVRAQHFAVDPALATAKMAPAFTVTALDGTRFNLDEMKGRVVLIDFWATWCGPCNAELPHMKKIARDFAGQPLVIISVSWDDNETKWRDFIDRNQMTWIQYRDADHSLSKAFAINSIPHYFTIDADGVLTAEMLGSGSDVEGKLKKLLAKAKAAETAPASIPAGN